MVFLAIFVVVALVLIFVLPVLADAEERHVWFRRFFRCSGWRDSAREEEQDGDPDEIRRVNLPGSSRAHYVVSPLQEEEIRDAYIQDRLAAYSMTLKAAQISPPTAPTATLSSSEALLTQHQNDNNHNNNGDDENFRHSVLNTPTEEFRQSAATTLRDDEDLETGGVPPHASTTESSSSSDDEASSQGMVTLSSSSEEEEEVSSASSSASDDDVTDESHRAETAPVAGDPMERMEDIPIDDDDDDDDCGTVWVPPAGSPIVTLRPHTNSCPICLGSFETDDVISWSHCADCPHVFHRDCIADWLNATGRKHMEKRRCRRGNYVLRHDPITVIRRIPMPCPCCRRPFIARGQKEGMAVEEDPSHSSTRRGDEDVNDNNSNNEEPSTTESRTSLEVEEGNATTVDEARRSTATSQEEGRRTAGIVVSAV